MKHINFLKSLKNLKVIFLKTKKQLLLSTKDIKLTAYPCPYEQGWHLSKI